MMQPPSAPDFKLTHYPRFDALQHLLIRLGGVVIAALLGLLATQL